jgi:hypothetical protein
VGRTAQGWERCIPRAARAGNAFAIGGIFGEISRRSHEENTDCPRVVVSLALLVVAQNREQDGKVMKEILDAPNSIR